MNRLHRASRAALGALALALALAGCGGGTTVERFTPTRIVAFGDENSVIDDSADPGNGVKYTINGKAATTDPTYTCSTNPIWIQTFALVYGLYFPQCTKTAPAGTATPSQILAAKAAKAGDLAAQVDQFLAAGNTFTPSDLATVLVGQHDILEMYTAVVGNTMTEADATVQLKARGAAAATQVNRIANLGAKVIVLTVPELSVSPLAVAAGTANTLLLKRLGLAYNVALRVGMIEDGTRIGVVLADELILNAARAGVGSSGYSNITDSACNAQILPVPATATSTSTFCSTDTISSAATDAIPPGGTSPAYLWADNTHLSPQAHSAIASIAVNRAINNPF